MNTRDKVKYEATAAPSGGHSPDCAVPCQLVAAQKSEMAAFFEQAEWNSEDHGSTWVRANWRPAKLGVIVGGHLAKAVLASHPAHRGRRQSLRLNLRVEYEGGQALSFKKTEELRLQVSQGMAKDHFKLKWSNLTLAGGTGTLGKDELPLWEHFQVVEGDAAGPGEVMLKCKVFTNITSKQHKGRRVQIRAELQLSTGSVEAVTQAVPFLVRPPEKQNNALELISDFKPGDRLTLFGDCLRTMGRGVAPFCKLRRSTDGEIWRLHREAKQGHSNPSAFVTRLPGDLTPGSYTLQVQDCSFGAHDKSDVQKLTIVARPAPIGPMPSYHSPAAIKPERDLGDLFETPESCLPAHSHATIKPEPSDPLFEMPRNWPEVMEPITIADGAALERQSSWSQLLETPEFAALANSLKDEYSEQGVVKMECEDPVEEECPRLHPSGCVGLYDRGLLALQSVPQHQREAIEREKEKLRCATRLDFNHDIFTTIHFEMSALQTI